jgi:SAM-dependent methyltransferase
MSEIENEKPQGLLERHGSWDNVYRDVKPEELPWNAGGPDGELVRLVESGAIPVGRAVDIGTGPGHDAVYLAQKGFKVLAVDISPKAIDLARSNARTARMNVAIDFRVEDVLKLSSPAGSANFVNDRACLHTLEASSRETYVRRIGDLLAPTGQLLLRTFSEKEPAGPGPHRFTRQELEDLFLPRFDFLEFGDTVLEGPRKPQAYFCLMQKKAPVKGPPRK